MPPLTTWSAAVEMPVDRLVPNDWNFNEMSEETFADLLGEIVEDGCDETIQVIPVQGTNTYKIINGEHRWKAAKSAGLTHIPVVVKDWDERTAIVKTARRNNIKGQPNPDRFKNYVTKVMETGIPREALARKLALKNDEELRRILEKGPKKVTNKDDNAAKALVKIPVPESGAGVVSMGARKFLVVEVDPYAAQEFSLMTTTQLTDAVIRLTRTG